MDLNKVYLKRVQQQKERLGDMVKNIRRNRIPDYFTQGMLVFNVINGYRIYSEGGENSYFFLFFFIAMAVMTVAHFYVSIYLGFKTSNLLIEQMERCDKMIEDLTKEIGDQNGSCDTTS